MLRTTSERRERAAVELFAKLRRPAVELIEHRENPSAVLRVIATGERVGLASRELMVPESSRGRSLEGEIRSELEALCSALLCPSGDLDLLIDARPRNPDHVRQWLIEFQAWLIRERDTIRERGGEFPNEDPRVAKAQAEAMKSLGAPTAVQIVYESRLVRCLRLDWMHVQIVPRDGTWGWRGFTRFGSAFLSDHGGDLDSIVLGSVRHRIAQARHAAYDGPLWLLLRTAVFTRESAATRQRIAALPGIDRFGEVWLLNAAGTIFDPAGPPSVRCLYSIA